MQDMSIHQHLKTLGCLPASGPDSFLMIHEVWPSADIIVGKLVREYRVPLLHRLMRPRETMDEIHFEMKQKYHDHPKP
jgi:hypothetical protein